MKDKMPGGFKGPDPQLTTGKVPRPPGEATSAELQARAQSLGVRILATAKALGVLRHLGSDVSKMEEMVSALDQRFADLRQDQGGDGNARETALGELEHETKLVEDSLLEFDRRIGRGHFRPGVEQSAIPSAELRLYARVLASRPFRLDGRFDRFEFLATHLLCRPTTGGHYQPLDRTEAKSVLRDMIGGMAPAIGADERRETLKTIEETLQRLAEFGSTDEFLQSGCYLDTYGYKLSVREQLKDPEILYKTVVLNAAIVNRLGDLSAGQMSTDQLREALEQQENEARAILEPAEPAEQLTSLLPEHRVTSKRPKPHLLPEHRMTSKRPKPHLLPEHRVTSKRPKPQETSPPPSAMGRLLRVFGLEGEDPRKVKAAAATVAVAAVLLAAAAWWMGSQSPSANIEALQGDRLQQLSPLLLRGWLMGGSHNRRLKAMVDSHKWDKMSDLDREQAADALSRQLSAQGVAEASVTGDHGVAIEIKEGTVTSVRGP